MKNKKKIDKILELSNNGIITTQQITSSGIFTKTCKRRTTLSF